MERRGWRASDPRRSTECSYSYKVVFLFFFFGLDCIPGYSCQTCSPQVGKRLAVAIFSAKPQIFSIPLRSIPLLVDQFFELCWRDVHALSITLLI